MAFKLLEELTIGRNYQLDSREVNPLLGEVDLCRTESEIEVLATILLDPTEGIEGCKTGVALDCSYSMSTSFGEVRSAFLKPPTQEEINDYVERNMARKYMQDGIPMFELTTHEAYRELVDKGVIIENSYPNQVEEFCKSMIPMLASTLDADESVTLVYCCVGPDGSEYEVVGDLTAESAQQTAYVGTPGNWGQGTRILPAIKVLMDKHAGAQKRFFIIITDGALDDFEEVKQFTVELAHAIDAGTQGATKLVLIGVGDSISVEQLEELDDLPDTMALPVDIWDHKIAREMRSVNDVFAEVVDENKMIASSADLLDDEGNLVHKYTDGLAALLRFKLPLTAKGFEIVLPTGARLVQKILA